MDPKAIEIWNAFLTGFVFLVNNGREAIIYIKNGFLIQIDGKTIKNVQIDK